MKPANKKPRYLSAVLAGTCASLLLVSTSTSAEPSLVSAYKKDVYPIVQELCVSCHGPDKQKGDLRLDQLSPDVTKGHDAEIWGDVLDQITLGEMPPPKEKQPSSEQRKLMVEWMARALREGAEAKRFAQGRVTTRRLTKYEYANTMRDLLGINLDFARDLPPEPTSPEGFLNNGATLEMSPTQIETYLKVARRALDVAIVTGERPEQHHFSQNETAVGKVPKSKVAGHQPVNPEYLLDVKTFPRNGEFEIKVRAKAAIPKGQGVPKMRVSMGHIPGIIHVPRITVGEVDVPDKPTTFTFRGRMEDYPQPGDIPFGNTSFKGMIVMIDFFDADGNELRYPDGKYVVAPPKPKKGQPAKPPKAPPFGSRPDILVELAEYKAPVFSSWPPESHAQLLPEAEDGVSEVDYVRDLLHAFMTRAFRRPVSEAEVNQSLTLFKKVRAHADSLEEAMRETYASILVSPHFLYIVERREKSAEPQNLDNYELANRLSYFLWSSMPDQTLFDLAKAGKLSQTTELKKQIERMLVDEKAGEFIAHFADQWFDLEALERVAVNPEFFPNFDNTLKEQMREETQRYLAAIINEDRSALELIDSDWTILNRQLARHYEVNGPLSSEFEKVSLKGSVRKGGLLGQGSFLLANANGEDSHPIKRAVWILDRLLDSPPAPPPPDVPELDPASPNLAKLMLKEQLAVHREKESCNNCHQGIDPWGVAFEHYDAIGKWRDEIPAVKSKKMPVKAVDAKTTLPNGTEVNGVDGLKQYILKERTRWFARSVVKRLMAYSLGRSLDLGDRNTVEELTDKFVKSDFRIKHLINDLVTSEAFLTK